MRAAAVQMNSREDVAANIEVAERFVREAAAGGADLVVLPEKAQLVGTPEHQLAGAEPLDGPYVRWARDLAAELGIDLVAGSFNEALEGHELPFNTSVHAGPDGELRGVYRKIHLFDVDVAGTAYRESASQEAGDVIVTSQAEGALLGMSICYDLRFPELYRILTVRGARVLLVPSGFTAATGAAHWDLLLRARAVENQAFVIAPDQVGVSATGNESYGGSLIADPWGDVLARAGDAAAGDGQPGVVSADLDLVRQDELRTSLPSLANRRPGTYRADDVRVGA